MATSVLQEKFLTTSAVGAVVVGFALQDTLGNAFSGLAIQTEKPYRAGQWIKVGDHEGRVEEITWRATKLRTKTGTFVIVPNNVMSKEAIVNFSEPIIPTRMSVDVGASYAVPPNEVKAAIARGDEERSAGPGLASARCRAAGVRSVGRDLSGPVLDRRLRARRPCQEPGADLHLVRLPPAEH